MMTARVFSTAALLAIAALGSFSCAAPEKHEPKARAVSEPLFDNLGSLQHPITTRDPLAQKYFDQGMRLIFAFNHEEAIRSFEQAARLDPDAAMAYWGIALALGPNINAPMQREQKPRAYEAIQKARAHASHVTPRERDYIDALTVRYSLSSDADRSELDRIYANAMRAHSKKHPEDPDAAALFAESLMDLRPWDFWTNEGRPQPGTAEIVEVLEGVLIRHPNHPGACHYYIHAVEASRHPERALPCAQRLPALMPGAGHLVHMPAHIYIRVGMYEEAVERNIHAVATDRHYLEGRTLSGGYPLGYYPHNIHFLGMALTMQGRSEEAIKASRDLMGAVSLDAIRAAPNMESFLPTPLFALARFGRWEEILREPAPAPDLSYTTALWHYARGLAFTAKGQLDQANVELRQLEANAKMERVDRIVGNNRAKTVLDIAKHVLSGNINARAGKLDEAIAHFKEAVRLQDQLRYYEPPDWYYPVRESLGTLLLLAGRPADAEAVFREDLRRTPENPWSLFGLGRSLRAQKADTEAAAIEDRFRLAWRRADIGFRPSRFEAFLAGESPAT
ncbi:MAG TPA: tetratricopeptide repeat protein [Nitrospirales bacterium]